MGKRLHASAPQAGRVCPVCQNYVAAEVTRHKTMGVFVPLWKPGRCHTPDCPEHLRGAEHRGDTRSAPQPHGQNRV
ncbi:hypothetical protein AB0G32_05250 [Streptomyces sp. NPDC023723]|uniref:hypothetical protein n=1 Tax=Streptomyces sp. NPDC023723 TaxID=3154323 RepID=UPI0033FDCE92